MFAFAPSTSTTVGSTLQHYTWPCTPAMLAELNDWLETPSSNYGWIIIGGEDGGYSAHRFGSRQNGTPENRPRLTISYLTSDEIFVDGFEPSASCSGS